MSETTRRSRTGSGEAVLALMVASCFAGDAVGAALFDEHEPLALEIEAPFRHLVNDRVGESTWHTGALRHLGPDGTASMLDITLRTRGKTRRRKDFCAFPPLRLRFAPATAAGTPFDGQTSLKLVTHCRNRDGYDQLVLQEYLAYRVYNLLTDYSHRVRLARVTYRHGGRTLAARWAILLEGWRDVAQRTGVIDADVDGGVNVEKLDHAAANRVAVFQFLIGNEDYSMLWPEPDENCCHNVKPLVNDAGSVIPLPYDFDFAGIVNARYAIPKPPNTDVRRRRYHGLCATQATLGDALALFRERRQSIYGLYRHQPGLTDRRRESTLGYLDRFYALIDDPLQVERRLIRACKVD